MILYPGQRWEYQYLKEREHFICEIVCINGVNVTVRVIQRFDARGLDGQAPKSYTLETLVPGVLPETCGGYSYLHGQDRPV